MPAGSVLAVCAVAAGLWITGVGIVDGAKWVGHKSKQAIVRLVKGKPKPPHAQPWKRAQQ